MPHLSTVTLSTNPNGASQAINGGHHGEQIGNKIHFNSHAMALFFPNFLGGNI